MVIYRYDPLVFLEKTNQNSPAGSSLADRDYADAQHRLAELRVEVNELFSDLAAELRHTLRKGLKRVRASASHPLLAMFQFRPDHCPSFQPFSLLPSCLRALRGRNPV